jgi:hypothetical protein
MARYPNLPFYSNRNNRTKLAEASKEELKDMYETIQRWGNALVEEIDSRDIAVEATPSTAILTVVTITDIGRPSKGNVIYSLNEGKYKGYVSLGATTTWQDLN